jgi:glutathione S-transferase
MSTPFTLIGTPYSTFTRTIALALQHKGLKYDQKATTPHSDLAKSHHPFGFLPTLVIHEIDGKKVDDILLRESHAIVRFIDRIAPEPSLHISAGDGRAVIEEKMWEMVSLIAFLGQPIIMASRVLILEMSIF